MDKRINKYLFLAVGAVLALVLYGCGAYAPSIIRITIDPASVATNGTVTMSCEASSTTAKTLTYTWSVSGGALSSNSGSTVTWTAPATVGTYIVTVTVSDGTQTTTATNNIVVLSQPIINIVSANPSSVAYGGTSTISCDATDPGGGTLTYTWDGGGGAISGSPGNPVTWSPPISATNGTMYTIKVDVFNQVLHAAGTANVTFVSNGNPIITTVQGPPTSISAGQGAQPMVCTVSNITNPYSTSWTATSGTISDSSSLTTSWTPPLTVASQTTAVLVLTVTDSTNSSISSTKTFNVIVNP